MSRYILTLQRAVEKSKVKLETFNDTKVKKCGSSDFHIDEANNVVVQKSAQLNIKGALFKRASIQSDWIQSSR